jgi:RNA polymerase sigma factor (sigma-70 family)
MIDPEGGPAREFDELFVRIRPELEGYARGLLRKWRIWSTTAGDVVQAAYVKLRAAPAWMLRVIDEESRARYIRSTVFSSVIDSTPGRGFAPMQASEEAQILDIAAPRPSTGPVTKADQRRFLDALRGFLSREDRQLLLLVLDEGWSFDEIAVHLGVTARSVRRRYEKVTRTLARRARSSGDEPEEDRDADR